MSNALLKKLRFALLCCLLLFIAAACSDKTADEKTREAERVAPATEHIVATGPVVLTLVPRAPTADNDINGVISGTVGANMVTYSWLVDGKPINDAMGESLSSSYFKKGQRVSLRVSVGTELVSQSILVVNSVPEVNRISLLPVELYAGIDVTIDVDTFDVDADIVGYNIRWFVNGIEVVTVQSNRLEGRQFNRGDEIVVEVVPYDDDGEGIAYAPLPVTVPNGPPSFTTLPPLSFDAQRYVYQAQATDPDGDELVYSLKTGPDGMEVAEDGLVTWQIGIMGVGTHEVNIVATDPEGAEAYQTYDLTIKIRR